MLAAKKRKIRKTRPILRLLCLFAAIPVSPICPSVLPGGQVLWPYRGSHAGQLRYQRWKPEQLPLPTSHVSPRRFKYFPQGRDP